MPPDVFAQQTKMMERLLKWCAPVEILRMATSTPGELSSLSPRANAALIVMRQTRKILYSVFIPTKKMFAYRADVILKDSTMGEYHFIATIGLIGAFASPMLMLTLFVPSSIGVAGFGIIGFMAIWFWLWNQDVERHSKWRPRRHERRRLQETT